jgi:hypothetical protein
MTAIYGTNKVILFGGGGNKNDTWIFNYLLSIKNGTYISKPYDIGPNSSFKTISWIGNTTINSSIKFQLRTSSNESNLASKSFIGPNGITTTFYTSSSSNIWSGHNGDRWIQYKAYFYTIKDNETPSLTNVTIKYNYWPDTYLFSPYNGSMIADNKPTFQWNFFDPDSNQQTAFQVIISNNEAFDNIIYDSSEQSSTDTQWHFADGTSFSETELMDGSWYWRVRTKDNDGDWGQFSSPFKLIIDTKVPFSKINYPLNNTYVNQINIINGISSDPDSSGMNRTELSILKVDPNEIKNKYWNGNNWIKNETWLNTIGTDKWFFDVSEVLWHANFIYIIQSRAIDNASNIENPSKGNKFIFDNIPPTITFFSIEDGKEYINTPVVNISYKIRDNRARHGSYDTSFSFDNKIWTEWEPIIFDNIIMTLPNYDGNKCVYMRLRDRAENIAEIVNDSIILDTMPPKKCSIVVNNDDIYTKFQNITLSLFANDSLSGINEMSFSFNSIEWTDWEPFRNEKTLNLPSKDGEKIIYFRVKDKANNIAEPIFDTINLDSIPPEKLSIMINENTEFTNSSNVNLKVIATDTYSGINEMSFSFESNSWTPWENFNYEKSITLQPNDGLKYVYFRISDKAGNIAEPIYDSIILDTTPPDSLSLKINNDDLETNTISVNLNMDAIDETSGLFQMSFSDNGILWSEWENYSKSKPYTLSYGNGLKTIFFRMKDKAGNIADPISSSIILNTSVTTLDIDGDGYSNDIDAFPNDPTQWLDSDGDNYGDNPNGTNPDAFPNDPTKWKKEDDLPDKKKLDDKQDVNLTWIIISSAVVILIIVIILILFLLVVKRKKEEKTKLDTPSELLLEGQIQTQPQLSQPQQVLQQPQPPQVQTKQQPKVQPTPQIEQPQQNPCSTCGKPLTYYTQNNRYYCHQCQKYE